MPDRKKNNPRLMYKIPPSYTWHNNHTNRVLFQVSWRVWWSLHWCREGESGAATCFSLNDFVGLIAYFFSRVPLNTNSTQRFSNFMYFSGLSRINLLNLAITRCEDQIYSFQSAIQIHEFHVLNRLYSSRTVLTDWKQLTNWEGWIVICPFFARWSTRDLNWK